MFRRIAPYFVIALAGVCTGVILARQIPARPDSAEVSLRPFQLAESDSRDLATVVQSLSERIDDEAQKHRELERRLGQLEALVADGDQPDVSGTQDSATRVSDVNRDLSVESRLVAAGFTPELIDAIRRREGEDQMRWIELDDAARREGWRNTPRYYKEIAKLSASGNSLLEDLGAEAYDRYLFATNKPNRVGVHSVFKTSPAEQAGLRAGDIIQSYAGQAIFSVDQLNVLRSSGTKGAPVIVEVFREGQLLQLTIPRGPMGVQPRISRVDPDAPSTEIMYAVPFDE